LAREVTLHPVKNAGRQREWNIGMMEYWNDGIME
jgi:hypothetical protein